MTRGKGGETIARFPHWHWAITWVSLALEKERGTYWRLIRSRGQSTTAAAAKAEVTYGLVIFMSQASQVGTQIRSQFVEAFGWWTTEIGLSVLREGIGVGNVCSIV